MICRVVPFVVLALMTARCGGPSSLPDDLDAMTIFSADGMGGKDGWQGPTVGEPMYGCAVIGSVEVSDPEQRREVMAAIKRAMQTEVVQYKCFWPRHIVRVRKGGSERDVVICFQCHNYQTYRGGVAGAQRTQPIASDPQPMLDKILTDAGVPLAPKLPL